MSSRKGNMSSNRGTGELLIPLLYKHHCMSFIALIKSVTLLLPCLYGAATSKRLGMVTPFIK